MIRPILAGALIAGILLAGCASATPSSNAGLRPAETESKADPSSQLNAQTWQTQEPLWVAHEQAAATGFTNLQALRLTLDFDQALQAYYQIRGTFPTNLAALERERLLFFDLLQVNGQPYLLKEIPEADPAARSALQTHEIGLEWGRETLTIVMPQVALSEYITREGRVLKFASIAQRVDGRFPTEPVQQLRDEHAQQVRQLAQQRVEGQPKSPGANKYLWSSDQMNEARLRCLMMAVFHRVQDSVKLHGQLPTTWEETLAVGGWKVRDNILSDSQGITPEVQMRLKVVVDPATLLIGFHQKPTLPDEDIVYYEFLRNFETGVVTVGEGSVPETLNGTAPVAVLLDVPVQTDPLPMSTLPG